jgi:hypothetical protein
MELALPSTLQLPPRLLRHQSLIHLLELAKLRRELVAQTNHVGKVFVARNGVIVEQQKLIVVRVVKMATVGVIRLQAPLNLQAKPLLLLQTVP